ncbi:MAG: SET domain-containing protein [Segetibacter sp.]
MALLEKYLQVKESSIPGAGKGLFTDQGIRKGARIVEYKGRIRTWKEVENEDENYYIFYVTEDYVIDASFYKKSPARFINDAKGLNKIKGLNNNSQFVIDGWRVFVEATRDIAEGAEILLSYGKEYWQVIRANQRLDSEKG